MVLDIIKDKGIKPGAKQVAQDRVTIQEALNDITEYTGMADTTSFNDDGTAVRPKLRAVVKGGKFVIDQSAG